MGKNKSTLLGKVLIYAIPLLLIPLLAYYISANYVQLMLIQGDSMLPTYHNLELVTVDKRDCSYTYGDVVAFECEELSAVLVKRIAACPNDKVVIDQGTLYVNDAVSTVYPTSHSFADAGSLAQPVTLGDEEYIVIGDNLSHSIDSRSQEVGTVSQASILGKIQ